MTQNVPWKIHFDSHAFMLDKPLASIGFGQKLGTAALVFVGIACIIRANQRPPGGIPPVLKPGTPPLPGPPPAPGRSKPPSIPPSMQDGFSEQLPPPDQGDVGESHSLEPIQDDTPAIANPQVGPAGDSSIPSSKRKMEAVGLNLSGEKAYRENHLDESVAMFRKAVDLDPGFAQAYANLGFVLPQMNRDQEAIEANRMALATAGGPNGPRIKAGAHYNIGKAHENMGDLKSAVASYRNVVNDEDGAGVSKLKAMSHLAIAKIAESEGNWNEALGAYQAAERISPSKFYRDGVERMKQKLIAQ